MNPFASSLHLRVVVVDLKVEEALALDEALPATVVALDVAAEEVLTEVARTALRVLEATVPDTEEPDELAVAVLGNTDVNEPDAPAVAEPEDPDVDKREEPALAVFQYAASRDCTAPTFRYASRLLKNATLAWIAASEKSPVREVNSFLANDLGLYRGSIGSMKLVFSS